MVQGIAPPGLFVVVYIIGAGLGNANQFLHLS